MNFTIPQYFEHFENLKAFQNNQPTNNLNLSLEPFYVETSTLQVESLLNYDKLFVIAEPGYGKSTLLQNFEQLLADRCIKYQVVYGKDDHKIKISEDVEYLIFDALDESKDVVAKFYEILQVVEGKEIKLIISNRTHYLSRIEHLLQNKEFEYIRLLPFSKYQILEFLKIKLEELQIQDEILNKIIENSKSGDGKSILSTPRYLNEFCAYIKESGLEPKTISNLKKSELFDKVIFFKLEAESKGNSNQIFPTKRVLERLALIMEIHELNKISKDDFITFLDQTNSNISLVFLNLIDLDDLLNRVMKPTGEFLEFEHTEFQEYLAAKELSRIGYRFQTIYDLMIDPKLQFIKSNWIDVLNYAIDIDKEFVNPVIRFIETRNFESVDDKLIEIILNANIENNDSVFVDRLFNILFNFYSFKGKPIYNVYTQIAKFITDSNKKIKVPLYKIADIEDSVMNIVRNQILLIEALAKKDKLSEEQKSNWKLYLIELLKSNKFNHIHTTIFHLLIAFEDAKPLLKFISVFEKKEDYILNGLFYPLGKLAPNTPETIALINRCLKSNRRLDNLDSFINKVTDEKGLISIFETLAQNPQILNHNCFQYSHGAYSLFENVNKINSSELIQKIKAFLSALFETENHVYFRTNIIELSLRFILNKNPKFIHELTGKKKFLYHLKDIVKALAREVDLETFKELENFILSTKHNWRHQELIYKTKSALENFKDNPIYAYIQNEYLNEWESNRLTDIQIEDPDEKLIKEYRSYFIDDPGHYHTGLIPFLINKSKEVIPLLQKQDVDYTKGVIEKVLKGYNPDLYKIEITKRKNNRTSFTHNQETWLSIESYFKAAYLLGFNEILIKHRVKFLKTFPQLGHYYDENSNEFSSEIFEIIGELTKNDIKLIYKFCTERKDDLVLFNARNFAENLKKLNLHQFIPLLVKLFYNEKIEIYDSEKVLEAIGELAKTPDDEKTLLEIFQHENNTNKQKDIANSYLIKKFKNEEAIIWRFQELKERFRPFDTDHKYNGTRGVSLFETELENPEFSICFYGIKNDIIYEGMLDILHFSFEKRSERMNFAYSDYLQKIIYSYFQAFINEKVLRDLRRISLNFHKPEQTNSFEQYIDKLVEELYLKQKSLEPFTTAVHSANRIIANKYLPIQSDLELKEFILSIIEKEIRSLIEDKGYYRVISDLSDKKKYPNEDLIQKTLKIALEKELIEKGLRTGDINREVESYDRLRYDYLISYGLFGPIMVELKLMKNSEIQNDKQRLTYKKKLKRYLDANKGLGIYVIFQTEDNSKHQPKYLKMLSEYKDLKGLDIVSLKCF
jgi:hypothetical protein